MATTSVTKRRKAGTILDLDHDPAEVTRPDGSSVIVFGGRYVAEADGEYVVKPAATS
jgi:hypothetical protein